MAKCNNPAEPHGDGCLSRYRVSPLEQQSAVGMAIYPTTHDLKVSAHLSKDRRRVNRAEGITDDSRFCHTVLVVLIMVEPSSNFARKCSAISLVQPPKPIQLERRERLAHAKRRSRLEESGPEGPAQDVVRMSKTYSASSSGTSRVKDLCVFRVSTSHVELSEIISPNDFVSRFHVWFLQQRRRCTTKCGVSTCQSTRVRRDARRSRHPP